MDSILTSIKALLGGIPESQTGFDPELIMHINSVFMTLRQLGVGPVTGFKIADKTATWDSFIPASEIDKEAVKTYIYLKVKLVFDPPASAVVCDALSRMADEYEWRLTNN